ncbi:M16 family metallopeptidase [Geofilum sp. OHC36d9]|uniref:M16 family metallopeptidase n=1 Tax=Geofilum sp. OHC36d9 TaxID=3458413 RepID=UPI0040337331
MKHIISTLLLSFITVGLMAQLDRSTPPAAGPAPKINIGKYQKFELSNGLKVFVVENHKLPMVTYSLTYDLSPITEGDAAGYIELAGSLMRSGTTSLSKDEIDEQIDFIGGTLETYASGIYGHSLKKHSAKLLQVMSDVLLNPSFPESEVEKSIRQSETNLQAEKNEPSAIAGNLSRVLKFGKDDPYGELMTEESLKHITPELLKQYHDTYLRPNISYLVIVGDITLKEAKKQVKQYFGKWASQTVPIHKYVMPENTDVPRVAISNRDGANQSTIIVTHLVPITPGHPDEIKASVMNQVLGGGSFNARLFQNLREDKAYTYGAYSSLRSDKRIGTFSASAQVRTSVTDSALTEILYEMKRLQKDLVSDADLELVKNMMMGSFSRSLEDPQTIARFALNIEKYNLPKDYYETYLEKVAAVTKEDVLAMAKKYLKPEKSVIIAVGNANEIREKMKVFSPTGDAKEYDFYGNEVLPAREVTDMTATDIINKFVEAEGGREALKKVTDITTKATFTIQGMTIEIKTVQKAPAKLLVESKMGGNTMSKQLFDGENGWIISPRGNQKLSGNDLIELKDNAILFPELDYEKNGFTMEMSGIENIDGAEAYKIIRTSTSGKQTTLFFDTTTGLKIREVSNTAQGIVSTNIKEYQTVNDIKIPSEIEQIVGPQSFNITITDVEFNTDPSDELFVNQ